MTTTFSLLSFVAHLRTIEADMEDLPTAIVARAAAMIAKQAKAQIGKQHEEWPPLAQSTLKRKAANTPLLETGELRDSIEWTVHGHGNHAEAEVGSNNDKAVWHELGTSRVPARPFLVPSAIVCEPKIVKMAARMTMSTLGGGGRNSRELRELLHAVRLAAHQLKKAADELFEDEEEHR
jgi:phage gpG-like protein